MKPVISGLVVNHLKLLAKTALLGSLCVQKFMALYVRHSDLCLQLAEMVMKGFLVLLCRIGTCVILEFLHFLTIAGRSEHLG
jgi:hypothetical protein